MSALADDATNNRSRSWQPSFTLARVRGSLRDLFKEETNLLWNPLTVMASSDFCLRHHFQMKSRAVDVSLEHCHCLMNPPNPRIEVSIGSQQLRLFAGTRLVNEWACSTSKFGIGFTEGSNKTPPGSFVVKEKHGDNAACGTIFKSRQPVGLWTPGMDTKSDFVLTRILWLHGLEPRNANTFQRYIYIHGTNDEQSIGRPASHGCVRLRSRDVIELYGLTPVGTPVWISE
jgi:hypothetical protein